MVEQSNDLRKWTRAKTVFLRDIHLKQHNRNKPASAYCLLLQQQQPRHNHNQTSNRQPRPRHLSLWTRSWDCWRTWNLTTTVTAMETAMMTIPAKRFASFRRWQLTWALQFWQRTRKCQRHCEAYPHLSQIAKVYLTLSASSVPVESMFSLAGLVKNSRRSSAAPHRLNRLCFVHNAIFFHWNNSTTVVDLWFRHADSDSYIKPLHN